MTGPLIPFFHNKEALILIIAIAAVIVWLNAEFMWRRNVRLICGVLAILSAYAVNVALSNYTYMTANARYGCSSKLLLDTVIAELEAGNKDKALSALHSMQSTYRPSAKFPDSYDVIVRKTVNEMTTKK